MEGYTELRELEEREDWVGAHKLACKLLRQNLLHPREALAHIGYIKKRMGKYCDAINTLEHAYNLADTEADKAKYAWLLARTHRAACDIDRAIEYLQEMRQWPELEGEAMGLLALCYHQQGKAQECLDAARRARELFLQNPTRYYAVALTEMTALNDLGCYAEACACAEACVDYYRQAKEDSHLANCQVERARALIGLGRYIHAFSALAEANELCGVTNDKVELGRVKLAYGQLYKLTGKTPCAKQNLQEAVKLLEGACWPGYQEAMHALEAI